MEHIRRPIEALIGQIAAQADLEGARNDLLQIRVAGEVIRQAAGHGGIRAAELDHGRRTACLVVVGVVGRVFVGVNVKPIDGLMRVKV